MRTVSPLLRTSVGLPLLLLLISCGGEDVTAPATGTLTVTAGTTGPSAAVVSYTLRVDGDAGRPLPVNGTATVTGLAAGDHTVELGGIPSGCTPAGANPRTVTVVAGEMVSTTFQITCSTPAGSLEITTTGPELDPDGYEVSVDGGAGVPVPVNGVTSIPNLAAGDHSVLLSGLAANCTLNGGDNPRTVTVVSGQATQITFEITCTPPGILEIITTTTGEEPDPDGYLLSVDGGAATPLPSNGITDVTVLVGGTHSLQLSGIADNCTLDQDNPTPVVVTSGVRTRVHFDVTCRVLPTLGGVILFQSDRSSTFPRYHLYRMKSDGSGVVDLTPTSDGQEGQISPSGRKIAFTSYRDGNGDIFLMNADGSGVTQLTRDPADDTEPTWSPDGAKIAFVSTRMGESDVWVMNADGSGTTRLTTAGGFQPSWSPDGNLIAFSRVVRLCQFDVCSAHIFVVPAGGGSANDLTANGDLVAFEPAWSPDGSLIAYERDRQIWAMQADGSGMVKLSRDPTTQDLAPVWSPDGSKIAFQRVLSTSQLLVMSADGSAATNISNSSANDTPTSWR